MMIRKKTAVDLIATAYKTVLVLIQKVFNDASALGADGYWIVNNKRIVGAGKQATAFFKENTLLAGGIFSPGPRRKMKQCIKKFSALYL